MMCCSLLYTGHNAYDSASEGDATATTAPRTSGRRRHSKGSTSAAPVGSGSGGGSGDNSYEHDHSEHDDRDHQQDEQEPEAIDRCMNDSPLTVNGASSTGTLAAGATAAGAGAGKDSSSDATRGVKRSHSEVAAEEQGKQHYALACVCFSAPICTAPAALAVCTYCAWNACK
jgi:hypothetical protein